MGFFTGASAAGVTGGGDKANPGRYPRVRIESVKVVNGHYGRRVLIHFTPIVPPIATSTQPDGKAYEPNKVGETVSVGMRIDGPQAKSGLGEVNAFGIVAFAESDLVKLESLLETMVDETLNPLKGKEMAVTVYLKRTAAGRDIFKANWAPADGSVSVPSDAPSFSPEAHGWTAHPSAAGYWYKGEEVLTSDQIKASL